MADAYEVVNLICVKIKLDKKLLQKLETTPRMVRVVFDDDEKKQITDYNVKNWLNALKDAVYADDYLVNFLPKLPLKSKQLVFSFFE
ncbi:hypothetical protein JHK85_006917 [Glycine max]|uniref:Disease resistance N-terminal domain-containing protein n=1 Tax=Glycine max TaxID=3847 RepID=K7KDH7_SOYBN|nr:hypothetical protein JHK85_006917 [Glycine max]KAG5071510.1 hypothetical protein JHK86_006721 [Glycine max]KAH1069007.1 hypothetical protein GYH30_006546 [Glycine max]